MNKEIFDAIDQVISEVKDLSDAEFTAKLEESRNSALAIAIRECVKIEEIKNSKPELFI